MEPVSHLSQLVGYRAAGLTESTPVTTTPGRETVTFWIEELLTRRAIARGDNAGVVDGDEAGPESPPAAVASTMPQPAR